MVVLIKEWYLLADHGEGEAYKGTGQILCVHLISHSFKVILLPCVLLDLIKKKKWNREMSHVLVKKKKVRKKKKNSFPSKSSLIWSADVPLHNISLVIISWSIIFMTWEQFFDRSKHLFNSKPQRTLNRFHMTCHTIKYDVPEWLKTH